MTDSEKMLREVDDLLWETKLSRRPWWQRSGIGIARVGWVLCRDLSEGQLSLRAMSLVYTTMLSLVPLLAISFSVLKGFNVHEELERAVVQFLAPLGARGEEIASRIIEFVNNVRAGVLGSIGLALLIYTVISLMQKIERSFNFIWHVPHERPFAQRFSGYLSVIMIGPVLVFSSVGITASLMNADLVRAVAAIEPFGAILRLVAALVPYLLVVGAFTFVYVFMPNTKVRLASAAVGSLIAGLLWNLAGWAFASFVVTSAQYTAVYSAFAGIIVFMLWLYFGWLILLIGSSIAFYHQHPEYLGRTRADLEPSPRMTEYFAFALVAAIVHAYRHGQPPPSTEMLARTAGIPPWVATRLMDAMARAGLVVAIAGDAASWLPAHPPEQIPVSKLLAAVRTKGEDTRFNTSRVRMPASSAELLNALERAQAEALEGRSLADLDVETDAIVDHKQDQASAGHGRWQAHSVSSD